MGVLIDVRLYQAAAVWSGWLCRVRRLGGAWQAAGGANAGNPALWQAAAGGLLASWRWFSVASYLWYNTQFVQFQGRYLSPHCRHQLTVAVGWREALRRDRPRLLAVLVLAVRRCWWLAVCWSAIWPSGRC